MRHRSILTALMLVVALATAAGAAVLPASLPVVARDADLIVAARVVEQRTVWHQERRAFVTAYRVQTHGGWRLLQRAGATRTVADARTGAH